MLVNKMQQLLECDFFTKNNRSINYKYYSNPGFLFYPFKRASYVIINSNLVNVPPSYALWIPKQNTNSEFEINSAEYSLIKPKSKIFPDTICLIRMTQFTDSILRYYNEQKNISFNNAQQEVNLKQVLFDQLIKSNNSRSLLPIISNTHLICLLQSALTQKINQNNILDIEIKLSVQDRIIVEYWYKEIGMSLNDILTQLKIKNTVQKLDENLSLEHISKDLGYDSISGFSYMFKRWTGTTPFRYKTETLSLFN